MISRWEGGYLWVMFKRPINVQVNDYQTGRLISPPPKDQSNDVLGIFGTPVVCLHSENITLTLCIWELHGMCWAEGEETPLSLPSCTTCLSLCSELLLQIVHLRGHFSCITQLLCQSLTTLNSTFASAIYLAYSRHIWPGRIRILRRQTVACADRDALTFLTQLRVTFVFSLSDYRGYKSFYQFQINNTFYPCVHPFAFGFDIWYLLPFKLLSELPAQLHCVWIGLIFKSEPTFSAEAHMSGSGALPRFDVECCTLEGLL